MINNDNIDSSFDYLGAVLVKKTFDRVNLWAISSQKYVKAVLENLVKGLRPNPHRMPS